MRGFKVDHIKRVVTVNAKVYKKMFDTSSDEYKEYLQLRSIDPEYKLKLEPQKTYDHDKYKGLTYKFIEAYIVAHPDSNIFAKQYIEERWKALGHSCGYQEVRAWFLQAYPEFDNMYFEYHQKPTEDAISRIIKKCLLPSKSDTIENQPKLLAE